MCDLNQIQIKDIQAVYYRKQSVTIHTSSYDFTLRENLPPGDYRMSWDFFLYNSIFLTSGHQTKNMRGNKITTCSHNNRCRLDQICADRCSSNLIVKSHSQSHHWCVNVYTYLNHQIQVHTLPHPPVCNLSFSGCCGTAYSRMKPMCCILHKLYFTQKNQWLNASPDCTHACTDLQRSHSLKNDCQR